MQDAHGPSSMPLFRSIAQMTTSRQATRFPMSTFSPPLLPDPVVPELLEHRPDSLTEAKARVPEGSSVYEALLAGAVVLRAQTGLTPAGGEPQWPGGGMGSP